MSPKPPTTGTGRSRWFGRGTTRLKSLAVVGTVTLGFAGAAFAAAGPASADPTFQFVQVGSDTIQFTMDAFANTVGGGIIGEYDAVNPLTTTPGETITPQLAGASASAYTSCSFTRPNGSGGGFKAMAYAYTVGSGAGTTTLGQSGTPPQANCISMSRSSSAPGSVSSATGTPGSLLSSGNFVYVPFAIDAVTYATGPITALSETTLCVASTTGCTNVTNGFGSITFTTTPSTIPQGMNLTVAQLQTLYNTCQPLTVGGTTLNPGTSFSSTSTAANPAVFTATGSNLTANQEVTLSGGVPAGFTAGTPYFVVAPTANTFELAATSGGTAIAATATGTATVQTIGNIDLYAPQNGSGTLAFWQNTMGVSAPQACWHQTIVGGPAIGVPVEEHDGSALASDPNGIAPLSIARFVAAKSGADPDRGAASQQRWHDERRWLPDRHQLQSGHLLPHHARAVQRDGFLRDQQRHSAVRQRRQPGLQRATRRSVRWRDFRAVPGDVHDRAAGLRHHRGELQLPRQVRREHKRPAGPDEQQLGAGLAAPVAVK